MPDDLLRTYVQPSYIPRTYVHTYYLMRKASTYVRSRTHTVPTCDPVTMPSPHPLSSRPPGAGLRTIAFCKPKQTARACPLPRDPKTAPKANAETQGSGFPWLVVRGATNRPPTSTYHHSLTVPPPQPPSTPSLKATYGNPPPSLRPLCCSSDVPDTRRASSAVPPPRSTGRPPPKEKKKQCNNTPPLALPQPASLGSLSRLRRLYFFFFFLRAQLPMGRRGPGRGRAGSCHHL